DHDVVDRELVARAASAGLLRRPAQVDVVAGRDREAGDRGALWLGHPAAIGSAGGRERDRRIVGERRSVARRRERDPVRARAVVEAERPVADGQPRQRARSIVANAEGEAPGDEEASGWGGPERPIARRVLERVDASRRAAGPVALSERAARRRATERDAGAAGRPNGPALRREAAAVGRHRLEPAPREGREVDPHEAAGEGGAEAVG